MKQSSEGNKRLVERLYRDCNNGGKLELLDELLDQDFVGSRGKKGPAGYRQTLAAVKLGFPDVQFEIEDLIAEGDRLSPGGG